MFFALGLFFILVAFLIYLKIKGGNTGNTDGRAIFLFVTLGMILIFKSIFGKGPWW